jgi:hypothetical protein
MTSSCCSPAAASRGVWPPSPKLGEQLLLVAGLEESHRAPKALRLTVHHAPEQDVPANGIAGDVRASHPGAGAADDVLQHDPVTWLDSEHAVQPKLRRGDTRCRLASRAARFSSARQQRLYLRPLPQGQGLFLETATRAHRSGGNGW